MILFIISTLLASLYFTSPTPRPRKEIHPFSFEDFRKRLQENDSNVTLNKSKQIKNPPKQEAQILAFKPRKPKS